MLNIEHNNLSKVLFSHNKLIENKNNIEKNISEGLLTFRVLVITSALVKEESAQLEKILTACNLPDTDYKILPLTNEWSYFRNSAFIKEVLLFGVTERDLNINIEMPHNQPVKFDNRVWVKTFSVAKVMGSRDIKNNLWQNALKPHFIG